jgi:hypothetical protein
MMPTQQSMERIEQKGLHSQQGVNARIGAGGCTVLPNGSGGGYGAYPIMVLP